MMASEYKKRGGGYTTDKKDETAKHLDEWTEEDWQTKEGSGHAKDEDGTEHRYLPKKAWEQMTEKEKEETDAKKQEGSKDGKQHVANTSMAAQAKKNASLTNASVDTKIEKPSITDCTTHWDDPEHMERNQREYKKFMEDNRQAKETLQDGHGGKKRGRGANAGASPTKKQKSGGGKRDKPTGAAGDITRVPKKGQKVQWHSLPGYIDGEVVEIVYEEKVVDGKKVKASKEDPRVVLKSDSSGKICVHKPEAVYWD
jgi:hypothetical protein